MVTQENGDNGIEARKARFTRVINRAYDLDGGMGIFTHEAGRFFQSRANYHQRPDVSVGLGNYGGNYLAHPYAFTFTEVLHVEPSDPSTLNPLARQHAHLIKTTQGLYEGLYRAKLRLAFGNNQTARETDLLALFTSDEINKLLLQGKDKGLVHFDSERPPSVEFPKNDSQIYSRLARNNVEVSDNLAVVLSEAAYAESIRHTTARAVTYQLGCMLALTDQVTYAAAQNGIPFSPSYKPPFAEAFETRWHQLIDSSVPDLGTLYKNAYDVFATSADSNDPIVEHLVGLQTLPQLRA